MIGAVLPVVAISQTVSIRDGNVFFKVKDGHTIQITTTGLDSDPSLSLDRKLVVFVRRTPSSNIHTGAGSLDTNELWVTDTTTGANAHRVLAGHSVDAKSGEPLAGFSSPRFSPDAHRVYFLAQIAATSQHVFMLDLQSQQVRFLCRGTHIEVVKVGTYAGDLIVLKDIPRVMPGHVLRYWLLDPNGREIGEIGEKESDLLAFITGRF